MHRFYFISKGQILGEFQNIEKFVIFWEKRDFEKGMQAMFPTLVWIEIRRLDLM